MYTQLQSIHILNSSCRVHTGDACLGSATDLVEVNHIYQSHHLRHIHDYEATIISLRSFILRSDIGSSHYGNWSRLNNRHVLLYTCLVVSTVIPEII